MSDRKEINLRVLTHMDFQVLLSQPPDEEYKCVVLYINDDIYDGVDHEVQLGDEDKYLERFTEVALSKTWDSPHTMLHALVDADLLEWL